MNETVSHDEEHEASQARPSPRALSDETFHKTKAVSLTNSILRCPGPQMIFYELEVKTEVFSSLQIISYIVFTPCLADTKRITVFHSHV